MFKSSIYHCMFHTTIELSITVRKKSKQIKFITAINHMIIIIKELSNIKASWHYVVWHIISMLIFDKHIRIIILINKNTNILKGLFVKAQCHCQCKYFNYKFVFKQNIYSCIFHELAHILLVRKGENKLRIEMKYVYPLKAINPKHTHTTILYITGKCLSHSLVFSENKNENISKS